EARAEPIARTLGVIKLRPKTGILRLNRRSRPNVGAVPTGAGAVPARTTSRWSRRVGKDLRRRFYGLPPEPRGPAARARRRDPHQPRRRPEGQRPVLLLQRGGGHRRGPAPGHPADGHEPAPGTGPPLHRPPQGPGGDGRGGKTPPGGRPLDAPAPRD